MIIIDGSHGEGGGQIVRTALALSTITGEPFRVTGIRKGRDKPGLKAQHVNCIRALQQLCGAKADGDHEGSEELLYIPGEIKAKNVSIDMGTAGSITLLLQSLLLPALFAKKPLTITLIGGTDTAWSMPIDYLRQVLLPHYRRFGEIELRLLKRGYYPKGGGKVELRIKPLEAQPNISLTEQGHLVSIKGVSHVSRTLQEAEVAERQARAAEQKLEYDAPVDIRVEYCDTLSTGSGITLWAIFSQNKDDIDIQNPIRLGADSLGERGKPAEKVGVEAAEKLIKEIESKAPVDSHLANNLMLLLGICAPSKIKVSKVTMHTETNISVVEQFLPVKFKIENKTITAM